MSSLAPSTPEQGRLAVYAAARAMGAPLVDVHDDQTTGERIEAIALDPPDELLVLLPARTHMPWFTRLPAKYVCFLHARAADGEQSPSPTMSSAVQYIGANPEKFRAAFAPLGLIYRQAGG